MKLVVPDLERIVDVLDILLDQNAHLALISFDIGAHPLFNYSLVKEIQPKIRNGVNELITFDNMIFFKFRQKFDGWRLFHNDFALQIQVRNLLNAV